MTASYSSLDDMANPITEISEVRVQLSEWQVTPNLHVWQHVDVCREMVAHTAASPSIG